MGLDAVQPFPKQRACLAKQFATVEPIQDHRFALQRLPDQIHCPLFYAVEPGIIGTLFKDSLAFADILDADLLQNGRELLGRILCASEKTSQAVTELYLADMFFKQLEHHRVGCQERGYFVSWQSQCGDPLARYHLIGPLGFAEQADLAKTRLLS